MPSLVCLVREHDTTKTEQEQGNVLLCGLGVARCSGTNEGCGSQCSDRMPREVILTLLDEVSRKEVQCSETDPSD